MDWFASEMAPFTVALLVAGGLLTIEVIGALMGAMPSYMLEGALDLDADGDAGEPGVAGPLGWLGFGRVPALVIVFSLLVGFGVAGVSVQWLSGLLLGAPQPALLASVPAALAALPATRTLARGIARVLPSEETEASSSASFVGQVARLGAATARPGLPAEAKITDAHGQTHYVRVVPVEGEALPAGSEREREAEQARILAEQETREAQVAAERAVREREIEKERLVREQEIEKERSVEAASVQKSKLIELAQQERDIAVAEKSRAKSEADAAADEARAVAAKAAEEVQTARATEAAERERQIEVIEARKAAERDAISITVAAEAEKQASADRADALRIAAEGAAAKARIEAEADAEAEKVRAEALAKTYEVEAEGKRAVNEAANVLSAEQVAMQVRLQLIEAMPSIIEQSVKPMENIEGIKILSVDGLGGQVGIAPTGESDDRAGIADQAVNAALRFRAQAPLIDSLMGELGIEGGELSGMVRAAGLPQANGANGRGPNGGPEAD